MCVCEKKKKKGIPTQKTDLKTACSLEVSQPLVLNHGSISYTIKPGVLGKSPKEPEFVVVFFFFHD